MVPWVLTGQFTAGWSLVMTVCGACHRDARGRTEAAALEAWGQELVPLPNKTGGWQTAECWKLVPSRGRGTASREKGRGLVQAGD